MERTIIIVLITCAKKQTYWYSQYIGKKFNVYEDLVYTSINELNYLCVDESKVICIDDCLTVVEQREKKLNRVLK